ncbi:MAG: prolipoprotein diacylglyceryl transferase [Deltaproteobacteria bacterium]|nr:prolipoprotein diacylglyceryl transferase [Deltaproteobacteria bacterium]
MHPVLLKIGALKIYSYGVFVAIGLLAATWVAGREFERKGRDREAIYETAFWAILSGILGARLFHVLVYWRTYAADPLEIVRLWNGGLVYYGGFLGGLIPAIVVLRRKKIPIAEAADAVALGIPLGLAFGRIGCTLAGCCYGKPCVLPWAVVYTDPASLAPPYVPLHPTQIYEAFGALGIFALLLLTRDRFRTPGMRFWTMLILYGVVRSFLEIFRDDPRGFLGPFSESQVVSAVLIAYAAASIAYVKTRRAVPPAR